MCNKLWIEIIYSECDFEISVHYSLNNDFIYVFMLLFLNASCKYVNTEWTVRSTVQI